MYIYAKVLQSSILGRVVDASVDAWTTQYQEY